MDWRIWAGLILTAFLAVMSTFVARNQADERNIHSWLNKVEDRGIRNSESIVRLLGLMEVHELEEHRQEK